MEPAEDGKGGSPHGETRLPVGAVAGGAVLLATGVVWTATGLMRTAATSFCGNCAGSARTELLGLGLLSAVLFGSWWAAARAAALPEARAVALAGAGALIGWAVAAWVAFGGGAGW